MAKSLRMTDDEILELVQPDIDRARSHQMQLSKERDDSYNLYRFQPIGNERPGFSQVVDAVAWQAVEWLKPNLHNIFTGDFFSLVSDDEERAKKFKQYIRYILFRKQDGRKIIKDFIHDSLITHFGILKCCYREDYDLETKNFDSITQEQFDALSQHPDVTVTKYTEVSTAVTESPLRIALRAHNPAMVPPVPAPTVTYENVKAIFRKVTFAGPSVEVVPAWEFYYVPGYSKLEDCPFVAHRVKRTLDDIRKGERSGKYRKGVYDKVKGKAGMSMTSPDTAGELQSLFGVDGLVSPENSAAAKNYDSDSIREGSNEVYVWECYFMADLDKDGLLEPAIATICEDVVLQDPTENPYGAAPFILGYYHREPHKVEGLPLPLLLKHEQNEQTNIRRLIIDSAANSTYVTAVTSNPQMAKQWAGRTIGDTIIGDPNQFREITPGAPSQFVLRAYEMNQAGIENKSGITKYNQGLDANTLNKTAAGITAVMNASQMRMKFCAEGFSESFERLIRSVIQIIQMYPPRDMVNITGTPIQVSPDDLQGLFDIEIDVGTGPQEKQQTAAILDQHIQFLTQAGIPLGIGTPVHVAETIYKKYSILDINAKSMLMPMEQILAKFPPNAPPQPQGPNPDQIKQMQDQAVQQIKGAQAEISRLQAELKRTTDENNALKYNTQKDGAEMQLEAQKAQAELAFKREELQAQIQMKLAEVQANAELKKTLEMMKIAALAGKTNADISSKEQIEAMKLAEARRIADNSATTQQENVNV